MSGVETEYTYTGKEQVVNSSAVLNHSETRLVYTGNSFIDVPEGGKQLVTISAEETKNYLAVSETVEITVNKAEAKIDVSGVETEYTYTGKEQTVTGAILNHNECELVYANNSFTTVVEGNGKVVKITAEETANYLAAEAAVEITVNPAKPGDAIYPDVVYPSAGKLVYGQPLSESALTGGSTEIGSFAWMDASVMPDAGLNSFEVVFTPVDVQNFAWAENERVRRVEIIVDPCSVSFTVENAEKIYGNADPEIVVAIGNVVEGKALDYTITRKKGEDAGNYAYIVTLGDHPNYTINLLVGTLTIRPRDISGKEIKVSDVADQAYTGSTLRPTSTVKFGDGVLKAGVDYSLKYSNNVEPGKATITITGKGNFTGSRRISFTILPPPEEKITREEDAQILNELLGNGTGDAIPPAIVFDGEYLPQDYELLGITIEDHPLETVIQDEQQGNSLLVCAFPDEEGNADRRSLILTVDQMVQLTQKQETEHIIFENGSAIAEMDVVDLLSGDLSKLMALILEGKEEITPDVLTWDWSLAEPAELVEAQLAKFDVEIRIVPVEMEDGSIACEVSVWLRWNGNELEVSDLIPSLTVAIAVDELVNEENFETFATLYTIAHQAPDEDETDDELPDITVLPGTLLLMPDELPEHQNDTAEHFIVTVPDEENEHPVTAYNADAHLVPYRHYVLATDYVGEGMYWVQKTE